MSLGFLLRKLVTLTLMPLGITIWLLLFALITRKRALIALAIAWLCLASLPFTGNLLIKTLEDQYPRMPVSQAPTADAIIVLGGVVADAPFGPGSIEWSDAVDRFEQGVHLMQAGKARRMIISGGILTWLLPEYSEAEAMRDAAIARGIPKESIIVVGKTEHTAAEASAIAQIMQDQRLPRAILVTSAFHMPRALMLFRGQQLDVRPFPADFHTVKGKPVQLLDFIPSGNGLGQVETAMKEFYGLAYYKVFPPPKAAAH